MSSEMMPMGNPSPQAMAGSAPLSAPVWSKQGREMARVDQRTEIQARHDFNQARLEAHRIQLGKVLETEGNKARAEVTQDVLLHVTAVHKLVGHLHGGDPGLELQLRAIQAAYNTGEETRVMRRGMGL